MGELLVECRVVVRVISHYSPRFLIRVSIMYCCCCVPCTN